jgi:oxygen-dependent protoporphyrinogen oxidase
VAGTPHLTVVGAGFSGLVAAFEASEAGLQVEVFESGQEPGGLLRTVGTPWGPVETAANGLLNSPLVGRLARFAGVELMASRRESRRRYIWRGGRARRWPLGILESLNFVGRLLGSWLRGRLAPQPGESVAVWGDRALGPRARQFLLAPALQGIYAESPAKLSASLLLNRFRPAARRETARLQAGLPPVTRRGTVAPEGGMGELVRGLEAALRRRGVRFHYGRALSPEEISQALVRGPVLFAVNVSAAAKLLAPFDAKAAEGLARVPRIALATTTLFFEPSARDLPGFGVLFPRGEGVEALGALFNTGIFEGRGPHRSETWILRDPPRTDAELLEVLASDRRRLTGSRQPPLGSRIQRWPEALPSCGAELEAWLGEGHLQRLEARGVWCLGNWTGSLGLSQIVLRARAIVERMRQQSHA